MATPQNMFFHISAVNPANQRESTQNLPNAPSCAQTRAEYRKNNLESVENPPKFPEFRLPLKCTHVRKHCRQNSLAPISRFLKGTMAKAWRTWYANFSELKRMGNVLKRAGAHTRPLSDST